MWTRSAGNIHKYKEEIRRKVKHVMDKKKYRNMDYLYKQKTHLKRGNTRETKVFDRNSESQEEPQENTNTSLQANSVSRNCCSVARRGKY